jgi:hypothetical protein
MCAAAVSLAPPMGQGRGVAQDVVAETTQRISKAADSAAKYLLCVFAEAIF